MGEEKNPILCPPSARGGGNNNITTRRIKEETANSLSRLLGCGERRRSSPVCAKKKRPSNRAMRERIASRSHLRSEGIRHFHRFLYFFSFYLATVNVKDESN